MTVPPATHPLPPIPKSRCGMKKESAIWNDSIRVLMPKQAHRPGIQRCAFLGGVPASPAVDPIAQAGRDLGPELLSIMTRLVIAIFLTFRLAAGLGLSGDTTLTNPIAVRLCEGFFLWSLALISCFTSRSTCPSGPVPSTRPLKRF